MTSDVEVIRVTPERFYEEVFLRTRKWRYMGKAQFEAMFSTWAPDIAVPLSLVGEVLDLLEMRPERDRIRQLELERRAAEERIIRQQKQEEEREREKAAARKREAHRRAYNASAEGKLKQALRKEARAERRAKALAEVERANALWEARNKRAATLKKVQRTAEVEAARRAAATAAERTRRKRARELCALLIPDSPGELYGTNNSTSAPGYAAHCYTLAMGRTQPRLWEEQAFYAPYQRR